MEKRGLFLHHSSRMMLVFLLVFGFLINGAFIHPAAAFYKEWVFLLKDSQGQPITDPVDVRLSLWDVPDLRSGDIDSNGNINTSAAHYGGYQVEVQDVTPSGIGQVNINTANISGFPETPTNLQYLTQLEYKMANASNTTYQIVIIDDDPKFDYVDRRLSPDYTSYLASDAPQTYSDTFTIDSADDASTAVVLRFGEVLNESLKFHLSNSRFELSDDLAITGGLSTTGAVDFSAASSFKNVVVSSDPGTCSVGQQIYNSTGNVVKVCSAANTWSTVDTTTDVNTLWINRNTGSGSYNQVAEFIYSGTSVEGAITAFYATLSIDAGATSYDARIWDVTNAQVIAETLGNTNNTQQIKDFGTVSNLPSGQALFQIQLRRNGGTTNLVRIGSLQYRH